MLTSKIKVSELFFILSIFCIPFVKAFTFKIGIPIKPTEIFILIFIFLGAIFSKSKINLSRFSTFNILLLAFIGSLLIVSCITFCYRPSAHLYNINVKTRINSQVDNILSLIYLLLSFLFYFVVQHKLKTNTLKYLNVYLKGGIVACILGWYLFLGSFFLGYFRVPLLPGMFELPQKLEILGRVAIRCGTFQEGNPFGLFIATCLCLSIYLKRGYYAIFFLLSSVITLSVMSIFGCIFIYNGLTIYKFFKGKLVFKYIPLIMVLVTVVILAFSIESPVQEFLLSKMPLSNKVEHLSKMERKLYTKIAFDIGSENIWTGIGLNNYSNYFQSYFAREVDPRMDYLLTTQYHMETKVLPNNIFALIFCEFGIFPFILFLILNFYLLFKIESEILKIGFITMILYFMTFPSINLFFIWFFYAFLAHSFKKQL